MKCESKKDSKNDSKIKILFLCVANSTRSQMAEGIAKRIFGDLAEIESAGSSPVNRVNPYVVKVLEERGINSSDQYSKAWNEIDPEFSKSVDYVITLCSEQYCPTLSKKEQKIHWPISDPTAHGYYAKEEDILESHRRMLKEIETRLLRFKSEIFNF